jgi:hypothetical protein
MMMHMPVALHGRRLVLVTRLSCSANLVFICLWLIMKHFPVSPISFVWIYVPCMSVFWQFTAEPFAYPVAVENIAATASSKDAGDVGPENTVNADTNWTGAGADDLWSTVANWSDGVPDEADVVTIASPPEQGPVIDGTVVAICAAVDGPGHESQDNNAMDVTGGSFTIVGDWSIAKKGSAIVNIGTINIGDDLNIGPKGGVHPKNLVRLVIKELT